RHWDRVEHLAGGDARDLEAEVAGGGREGERLLAVDRERSHAPVQQRPDFFDYFVGRGFGDGQVARVARAHVHVFAVETHDRVVRTCSAFDLAEDVAGRGFE